MTRSSSQPSLYEQDFALWAEDTIVKLKAGKFDQLDLENVIEEIAALVRSDKRELESRLKVLLAHILKRTYVSSAYDNHGWEQTIDEQRDQLISLLKDSPSLKGYFDDVFPERYQKALKIVRKDYPKTMFPSEWQFSQEIDVILNDTFWEEEE